MTSAQESDTRPYRGPLPSENGAHAAVSMQFRWPELDEFVSIATLAETYYFDWVTLEVAAKELVEVGVLETQARAVVRKWFFIFKYDAIETLYRRVKR